MEFEFNLNRSLSSFEEIFTPQFETNEVIFADIDGSGNTSSDNNCLNENQYNCPIHQNYKLSMICVECTTLVCQCCVKFPIHNGHQHLEVESDSMVFKKIYYCMTNFKDKINNVMEIAFNEYENIRNLVQEKEMSNGYNLQISIDTQVDVFLDFIDLAVGDSFNFNNNII